MENTVNEQRTTQKSIDDTTTQHNTRQLRDYFSEIAIIHNW